MTTDEKLRAENERLRAENERLRDAARNYETAMYGARGERDSERAEVERLWVNLDESREYTKKALAERDAAREQVRQRDEAIERVRAALAGHPECDRYPNDGGEPILCGWKRAVVDVRAALEGAES